MGQDINILVIEDKKEDALFLEKTLKSLGYKLWLASTKEEASSLVKHTSFAAVLTELHMPSAGGADITEMILDKSPFSGVLIITTYSFIASAVEVMEKGAYGYITKPFNPAEIRVVLERAVERFLLLSSDKEKEQFAQLSIKDGLTGIYNRRFFNVFLDGRVNKIKQSAEKFSLLMIDIDNFKMFNDSQGHLAGDKLLRDMAKLFQGSVREEDSVFRYGGEEFIVFLDFVDKEGAVIAAERIRSLVALYEPVTVSIGISTFPDDGQEIQELISRADSAMYKAKQTGKNKVYAM